MLLQGTTITLVSKWLGVDAPGEALPRRNVEFEFPYEENTETVEYDIQGSSEAVGKQIVELGLPESAFIMLIKRGGGSIVPRGATVLDSGDRLLIMARKDDLGAVRSILGV